MWFVIGICVAFVVGWYMGAKDFALKVYMYDIITHGTDMKFGPWLEYKVHIINSIDKDAALSKIRTINNLSRVEF